MFWFLYLLLVTYVLLLTEVDDFIVLYVIIKSIVYVLHFGIIIKYIGVVYSFTNNHEQCAWSAGILQ